MYKLASYDKKNGFTFGLFKNIAKNKGETLSATEEVASAFGNLYKRINDTSELDDYIDKFDTLAETCGTTDESFIKFLKTTQKSGAVYKSSSDALRAYEANLQAEAKAAGVATYKTEALSIVMKAASAIGWMVAITAITEVISGVVQIAQVSSQVSEQAQKTSEAFNEESKSLDENKSKIEELRAALSDENLSYEEAYNKRKELLEIQSSLVTSYGSEADGIDLVNGKIDDQIAKLDELKKKKAQDTLDEINENTTGEKWFNAITKGLGELVNPLEYVSRVKATAKGFKNGGLRGAYDSELDYLTNSGIGYQDIFGSNVDAITKKVEEFQSSFKKTGDRITDNILRQFDNIKQVDDEFVITGSVQEVSDTISEIQSKLSQVGIKNDSLNKQLDSISKSAKDIIKENMDSYNTIMEAQILQDTSDGGAASYYKKLTEAYAAYQDAVSSGNNEQIDDTKKSYGELIQEIENSTLDLSKQDFLKNMFPDMQDVISDYKFEVQIQPTLADGNSTINKSLSTLSSMSGDEIIDAWNSGLSNVSGEQANAITALNTQAKNAGMSLDDLIAKLQELKKVDDGSNKIRNEILDRFSKASNTLPDWYKKEAEAAKQANEEDKEYISTLNEIEKKYGNVSNLDRDIIYWDKDSMKKWDKQISSWGWNEDGNLENTWSTVLGDVGKAGELSYSFTALLNTDEGAIPLTQDEFSKYIDKIVDGATENGKINSDKMLQLDTKGIDMTVNGKKLTVKNLLAGVEGATQNGITFTKDDIYAMSGNLMPDGTLPQSNLQSMHTIQANSMYGRTQTHNLRNKAYKNGLYDDEIMRKFLKTSGIENDSKELDKFNKLTQGIQRATDAIQRYKEVAPSQALFDMSSDIASVEQFKTSIQSTTECVSALSAAMKEQTSTGYLTADTYNKLIESDSNYSKMLQYYAGYMQVDTEKAKEYTKAVAEQKIAQLELKEAMEVQQYNENAQAINKLQSNILTLTPAEQEQLQSLKDTNSQIEQNISSYDMMESELRGVTSAYNDWVNGMSSGDYGDQYDAVVGKLKDMKALYDEGAYGSKDLNNFSNMVFGKDFDKDTFAKDLKDVQTYLTTTGDGIDKFAEKCVELGHATKDASGAISFQDVDVSKLADDLGLSVEMVNMLFDKMQYYDGTVTFKSTTDSIKNLALATNDVQEAMEGYQQSINNLNSQGIDTTEAQKQLNDLKAQWDNLNADQRTAKISEFETTLTTKDESTPTIEKATKQATEYNKVIASANKIHIYDPGFGTISNRVGSLNSQLTLLNTNMNSLNGKKVSMTINQSNTGGKSVTFPKAQGTFNVGSAFAHGSGIGAKESGISLTGELGEELVVRGDRYFTVGSNGAEFANIKKGDIVFNAEQTRELLYGSGKIQSRGVALARGTTGNAYATVSATHTSNKSKTKVSSNGKSSGTNKSNKSKSNKTEIDWIERHLNRINSVIDLLAAKFENLFNIGGKDSNLKQQIDETQKLINSTSKAVDKYDLKAKKVAKNTKLSKSLQKAVQEGRIDSKNINKLIAKYGEKTANKIQEYQKWWDKAREAERSHEEAIKKQRELYEQMYQLRVDEAEANTSALTAKADNTTDYKKRNKYYSDNVKWIEQTYKYQIKIAELTKDTVKVEQLRAEQQKALTENAKKMFDNVAEDYSNRINVVNESMSRIDREINKVSTSGANVHKKYYKQQLADNEAIKKLYEDELKIQEESLSTITSGTQEWYDARQAIEETRDAISECTIKTMELNKAITELSFKMFDDIRSQLQRVSDEYEFIASLAADKKNFDSDTAEFTDNGYMNLGIAGIQSELTKRSLQETREELEALLKAEKNADDSYNLFDGRVLSANDYQNKLDELYDKTQSMTKSLYDYNTSKADIMKEHYQAVLDVFNKLVDKQKEAINVQKDLLSYQRNLKSQTDDIMKLQRQLSAYNGDTSSEGMARRQKLQSQLNDANKKLKETEEDKALEDIANNLDKMSTEFSEMIQKKMEDRDGLLSEANDKIAVNTATVKDTIEDTAASYDYTQQYANFTTALGETGSIVTAINNQAGNIIQTIKDNSGTKEESNSGGNVSNPPSASTTGMGNLNVQPQAVTLPTTSQSSAILQTSSHELVQKLDGKKIKKQANDYIKSHLTKATKKKASDYSDVNAVFFNKNGKKVLSDKELHELAKIVGVKFDNAKKTGSLYKALHELKIPGFSKGGVVSEDIKKILSKNGDNSLATVKVGERILTPVQNENFEKLIASPLFQNPSVLNGLENIAKIPDISKVTNNNQGNITVEGTTFTFNLDNVTDTQTFLNEIKNNKSVQNAIQTVVYNPMVGKSINSVKHI